jgi:hypothetical protein
MSDENEAPPTDQPKPAWKSSQIVMARFLYVPVGMQVFKHTPIPVWLANHAGIDLVSWSADTVIDTLTAGYTSAAALVWEIKRRKAGHKAAALHAAVATGDVSNVAALLPQPIQSVSQGVVAQTVARLTGDVKMNKSD